MLPVRSYTARAITRSVDSWNTFSQVQGTSLFSLGPDTPANFDIRVYCATAAIFGDVEIKTMDDLSGMKVVVLIHPWISPLLDQEFLHGTVALDSSTRVLRFVARLRQPFGALLLAPLSRVQYSRVAADSLLMVQVCEEALASLTGSIDGARTVGVQ